jgi:hypothetical protein
MIMLSNQRLQALASDIKDGKCIIFLGPGATVNFGNPDRQALFFRELAANNPEEISAYHDGDGMIVFKKPKKMRHLYENTIRDFFHAIAYPAVENPPANPLLENLAKLPFHVVISVTPDLSLQAIFEQHSYAYFDEFYAPKIKAQLPQAPSSACPLIYNLMGCVKDPQTIICCHDDMFGYLTSFVRDLNLPDEIATMFNAKRTQSIVFMGFEFDKWYFQLLVHILGVIGDDRWQYAVPLSPFRAQKTILEAQINIEFVDDDLLGFVNQLLSQFDLSELRKPSLAAPQRQRYNKTRVLQFVIKAFSPAEFEVFCMIHFEVVYQDFTPEMSQTKRIAMLIDHVERHGQFQRLLEIGRSENSLQYEQCGPYHES